MASISKNPNGRRTIQFVGSDGKRRSIRWVRCRNARPKHQVSGGAIERRQNEWTGSGRRHARWVADRDVAMADKLAAVGLIPRRERATLQAFLDSYIKGRTDVKLRTTWKYETTRQNLLDFFGPGKNLRDITPAPRTIGGCGWQKGAWLTTPSASTRAIAKHFSMRQAND